MDLPIGRFLGKGTFGQCDRVRALAEKKFGGKAAVISSFRLGGPAESNEGKTCPPLANRMEKEAIHELGHTFQLRHCSDPDCVMHYSVGLQCADRKFAFFCPACRDLRLWYMARDLFLKS